jgi:hypothetical protein
MRRTKLTFQPDLPIGDVGGQLRYCERCNDSDGIQDKETWDKNGHLCGPCRKVAAEQIRKRREALARPEARGLTAGGQASEVSP